ncbi:MAG: acetate kinase [Eubacteriales bacterium]|nr:acetate kinase [Eubacteriales bacterium]
MIVLVINSGSSSLKYQLIDAEKKKVLAKGLCDRIGIGNSFIKHTIVGGEMSLTEKDLYNHKVALSEVIKTLTTGNTAVISSTDEIGAIGHRVVHGGELFHDSVIVDDDVLNAIRDCIELAPLHNPANITGIEACQQIMPGKPNIAVFDTAFHQTIPTYAYLYALPYEIYEKYKVRKYGFHGTSHKFVSNRAAEMLQTPIEKLKIISCHLGNGASICAVKYGKSVDTSMGFTPLSGLVMGTRSGNVDPAAVLYLMDKENMKTSEVNDYLNKKSGVLGISGISSDFRDITTAADEGNERAKLAIEVFCYRVKQYIAEYAGVMNGVDAVVFTAGIGENDSRVREMVVTGMDFMGIAIDKEKNKQRGVEIDISTNDAKVKTLVVPTNEELAIARETIRLLA